MKYFLKKFNLHCYIVTKNNHYSVYLQICFWNVMIDTWLNSFSFFLSFRSCWNSFQPLTKLRSLSKERCIIKRKSSCLVDSEFDTESVETYDMGLCPFYVNSYIQDVIHLSSFSFTIIITFWIVRFIVTNGNLKSVMIVCLHFGLHWSF